VRTMVKLVIVDDHEALREALALLLTHSGMEVVGAAGNVAAGIDLVEHADADVALVDIRLPDGSGIDLCRDLLASDAELRCLILTSFTDEQSMLDAILAGASGYVVKDIRGMELAATIKAVGAGKSLLDNRAAAALMSRLRKDTESDERLRDLSSTERTLLQLLGEGLTNREIGQRMFLAEKTIKNYVSRLLIKLGLSGRTQAALLAADTMPRSNV
jgi:two-component system response regulator DevR